MAHRDASFRTRLASFSLDEHASTIQGLDLAPFLTFEAALEHWRTNDVRFSNIKLAPYSRAALDAASQALPAGAPALTRDQRAAIHLFTQDSPVWLQLTARLRERERGGMALAPFLKLLVSAFLALPSAAGTFYRKIFLNFQVGVFRQGSESVSWEFVSVTNEADVAARLGTGGEQGQQGESTNLEIVATVAYDIKIFSARPADPEFILLPGTRMRIDRSEDKGNGALQVHATQLPSRPLALGPLIPVPAPPMVNPVWPALGRDMALANLGPLDDGRGGAPAPGSRAHRGMMHCKCAHARGFLSAPLNRSLVHLNTMCRWQCCGQQWDEESCTESVGAAAAAAAAAAPVGDVGVAGAGALARAGSAPGAYASGVHSGLMQCACGHRLGTVPFPLSGGYYHSTSCNWLCCDNPWSSDECTQPVPAPAGLGHPGLLDCQCLHRCGLVPFPLDRRRIHVNDSCRWQCCGADWRAIRCTASLGAGTGAGAGAGAANYHSSHRGMMHCQCSHDKGMLPAPLDRSFVHLNTACRWQCCGAQWDDEVCAGSGAATGTASSPLKKLLQGWSRANPRASSPAVVFTHTDAMACGCPHDLGVLQGPLDPSYYHDREHCRWLCCGADWDNPRCETSNK